MAFRFRFSIRALGVLLTLVCLYLGCWSLTDRFGIRAITSQYEGFRLARSPAPLIVSVDSNEMVEGSIVYLGGTGARTATYKRYRHLWIFGVTCKLPWDSTYSTEMPDEIIFLRGYTRF